MEVPEPPAAYRNSTQLVFPDYEEASKDWNHDQQHIRALSFIADDPLYLTEKSFCINIPLPSGQPRSNLTFDKRLVEFCSARAREATFSLDKNGFCFVKMPELSVDLHDTQALRSVFIAEMEQWLQDRFKADLVQVFDYTLRQVKPFGYSYNDKEPRPPANAAHIDQTPGAAVRRMTLHLQKDLTEFYNGRIQLVNLWRALNGPLKDSLLSVCDSRTIERQDLMEHDLVFPHYVGENFQLKYNPKQRWYFLDGMEADEAVLFKNFDSMTDGRARLCPHGSFKRDPPQPHDENEVMRASIEIRAIIFHKKAPLASGGE
ncbi:hypothetical protein B0T16DRAFT_457767 [Cercophora newfieldiana]|uniref:CmcJ-like methyltransferase n=1 Tax=Cercophora newfieldiana TaxID=92897 RepID=A0AA39Y4W2_9PEZI|nr:hypothetical protein B0T16DRAFT_457767 [Cercophora newfieldiana]